MRRVWAGLVFAVWVGVAPAQSPPARPAPQPSGDILVQKTAGQPDRRLRLLKLDTGPDGERVADLQDLGTGARYTVPAAALAGMKRVPPTPAEAVHTTPPPAPQFVRPATSGGKFPTSLPLPEPSPGGHPPFVARQYTQTPEQRTRPQTQPVQTAPPVAPPPSPGSLDTPLTALVVAPPVRPVEPVRYTEPARPVEPPPLVLPPAARPVEPPALATPVPAADPPTVPPMPVVADPAPAQPVVFRMSIPAAPTPAVAPWQMTRSEQMRAEIEPYTNDLVNALRPSVRERAATALANGRHASQPEVKGLLARTAMTDPAPGVQAHCVRILSALGYHATDYVEYLELSLGSDTPALRQAAAAALSKLAPR